MQETIAGVLLAGGLGRRMGGADKALVNLAGRPLVSHAAERLRPQVSALILNANGDPARFAALGLPVVADEAADFQGPLAGVLAALQWFRRERPEVRAIASLPADAPFAPEDLVRRLEHELDVNPGAGAAVAQSRERRHYVIGLWRIGVADEIAAGLAAGQRRAEAMIDRLGAVAVPFPDLEIGGRAVDPFFNVNTPQDLATAEAILSSSLRSGREGERAPHVPFVIGIAGWKNSGKTTLVTRLVAELVRRGYRISTVKHSHHDIAFEREGTDSARHRAAGAQQVAVVSPRGWGVISDHQDFVLTEAPEPPLAEIIAHLVPADIVLVEGMKRAPIPKIEVRRTAQGDGPPLADGDVLVVAIAADHIVEGSDVPVFALDDVEGLVQIIIAAARKDRP